MLSFGKRLREVRKKAGLSQSELAKKLGYKRSGSISNIEADKTPPDIQAFIEIANLLDVDLHWLITGQEFPKDESPFEKYREAVRILAPNVYTYLSKELKAL